MPVVIASWFADGVDFGIELTTSDWIKLIAIVLVVLIVGIWIVTRLVKATVKAGKFARDVHAEVKRQELEQLPQARVTDRRSTRRPDSPS